MENKKSKSLYLLGIVVILVTVIGLTYAFFAPEQGGTTNSDATVTSNTTDLLTFQIDHDISFTVTQADFVENGNNKSGNATVTATLTPNNKTGAAVMNYYVYLNIESNPTVHSIANIHQDPELLLQVFDGNNQLVTLDDFGTQKTVKGLTGYDITGIEGLKTLLNAHTIVASNNTATIENWRVVITMINLDVNQNDNTGKTIEATLTIQKSPSDYSGPIYRTDAALAYNGSSITPEIKDSYCDVEIESGYRYDCFDSLVECNDALEDWGVTETNRCELRTGISWCAIYNDTGEQDTCFDSLDLCNEAVEEWGETEYYTCEQIINYADGLEDYETNVNIIKDKVYSVYCETSYCYNDYYTSLEECNLNKSPQNVCEEKVFFAPIYIKHQVVNNIINSSSICYHHNNEEVCFDNNEWLENDSNGTLTKQSLLSKLEDVGEYNYCYDWNNNIKCDISDGPDLFVNTDGSVSLIINDNVGCYLNADGTAYCDLPPNSMNLSNRYLIIQDGSGKPYDNPHLEDFLMGIKGSLVPIAYNNDIDSYLSTRNHEEFILWTKNDGYDACLFLLGKMVCVNDLFDGTPGISNLSQTVQIVQNRIETQLGNTTQSHIYDTYDTFADILIPGDRVLNNKIRGVEMRIFYDNESPVVTLYSVPIDMSNQEWTYGESVFYCGISEDSAGCYNE